MDILLWLIWLRTYCTYLQCPASNIDLLSTRSFWPWYITFSAERSWLFCRHRPPLPPPPSTVFSPSTLPSPSPSCLSSTLQILTGSFECPTLPASFDDVSCSAVPGIPSQVNPSVRERRAFVMVTNQQMVVSKQE